MSRKRFGIGRFASVVVGCAVMYSAHAGTVHVVGASGYSTFAAAYAAAADGDSILVDGNYQPFSFGDMLIGNKSLTVVGQPNSSGSAPKFNGISIEDLAASKRVTVRGFVLTNGLTPQGTYLVVDDNAGVVVLEDVSAYGVTFSGVVRVTNCANVTLTRCSATGPNASIGGGASGLVLKDSVVHLYGGTYVGGSGGSASTGGSGVTIDGGFVFLHGVLAAGGNGGTGASSGSACSNGGDGGSGVYLKNGNPKVVGLGNLFVGGFPGPAGFCATSQPGAQGSPVRIESGDFGAYADTARSVVATSPVREGQATTLTIKGQPNEAVFLFVSPVVNPTFVPALKGALLPLAPFTFVPFGNMPPAGPLVVPVTIPSGLLPPGTPSLDVYVQTHVAGAAGTGIVGIPTVLSILDPAL